MNPIEFGARINRFRGYQKLSVAELARKLGIDYMQVSRYEKGKGFPSLDSAVRLARVLKVSLDQLVLGTDPPEPPAFKNTRLYNRMLELDRLPAERQEMALRVLDTVIAGYQLEDLSRRLRG